MRITSCTDRRAHAIQRSLCIDVLSPPRGPVAQFPRLGPSQLLACSPVLGTRGSPEHGPVAGGRESPRRPAEPVLNSNQSLLSAGCEVAFLVCSSWI